MKNDISSKERLFTVPLSWEIYRGQRIDRTTTLRRTVKRETNENFGSTMQNSTEGEDRRRIRYYQRMRILRPVLSLSLSPLKQLNSGQKQWLTSSLPPCHWIMDGFICSWQNPAASPRGDESRRVKFGVKSALRCDGTWIFISVLGCGLFRTPPKLAYFKRKSVRTEGGCKFLLLFSFYSTSGKWGDLIKWNFVRESFYNYSISR